MVVAVVGVGALAASGFLALDDVVDLDVDQRLPKTSSFLGGGWAPPMGWLRTGATNG